MDRLNLVITSSLIHIRAAYLEIIRVVNHFRLNAMGVLQGPDVPSPNGTLIHLFNGQFKGNGEFGKRIALIHDDKKMTFSELRTESEVFACNLAKMFQTKDSGLKSMPKVFGLFTAPGTARIASIIGLLELNRAYLPLDFTEPTERIALVLQDSGVRYILYDDKRAKDILLKVRDIHAEIIAIDINHLLTSDSVLDIASLQVKTEADPLICVLYTSGSTGVPKGVPCHTSRLLNRLSWQWEEMPFIEQDVGCQKTSMLFVDSLTETFICLLKGIPIVILSVAVKTQPELFINAIHNYKISRLVLVPSLLEMLINYLKSTKDLDKVFSIRTVISSGESLPVETATDFFSVFPLRSTLYNLYGSTETAGDVLYHKLEGNEDINNSSLDGVMCLGTPVNNSCVVLLNNQNEICKEGIVGKIHISGANVATGYLNASELNIKFFFRNRAFRKEGHTVLFNMGDLGVSKNGRMYFKGRSDSQVKIRGHRVDLNEIQMIVKSIDGIDMCVVLPYRDVKGYIVPVVAYVSDLLKEDVEATMKLECQRNLQRYAMPRFFKVEEFPLQPQTGKLDRQKLIEMFKDKVLNNAVNDKATISKSRSEKILSALASNLSLPLADIRQDVGFFENGGHSLSAISLLSELKSEGIELSLSSLLSFKTIQQLTAELPNGEASFMFDNNRFVTVMLNSLPNKEDAINITARGFSQKNPLDLLAGTSVQSIEKLIRSFWQQILQDDLSVIVIDRSEMKVVGVTLNLDVQTEVKAIWDKPEVCQINEAVEEPVKRKLIKNGGRWADSLMAATDPDLDDKLGLTLLEKMTEFTVKVIQNRGYNGIVEVNSHPVTMALAKERFGFVTMNTLHVKTFCYLGRYPFHDAEDSYNIKCMVKHLQEEL